MWLWFFLFPPKETVLIIRFSGVEDSIVAGIEAKIKRVYHVKTKVLRNLTLPEKAYISHMDRYDARVITNFLDSSFKGDYKIIGLTDKPLSFLRSSGWWYSNIYGLGDMPGQACLISTESLDSSELVSEMAILAIHELGHTYGLYHCEDDSCYMTGGDGMTASFKECTHFCISCEKKLKKLRR